MKNKIDKTKQKKLHQKLNKEFSFNIPKGAIITEIQLGFSGPSGNCWGTELFKCKTYKELKKIFHPFGIKITLDKK